VTGVFGYGLGTAHVADCNFTALYAAIPALTSTNNACSSKFASGGKNVSPLTLEDRAIGQKRRGQDKDAGYRQPGPSAQC
jgi:hypothetical protein